MAILSLDEDNLRNIIQNRRSLRFTKVLEETQMDKLPRNSDALPKELSQLLKNARWERFAQIGSQIAIFGGVFIYSLVINAGIIPLSMGLILGGACILLFFFFSRIQKNDWAEKQLEELLQIPYLFIFNGNIYANFPHLLNLDQEIEHLHEVQDKARNSLQDIDQLCKKMKEKLILLGQDTNDQYLMSLETQKINQARLIEEAQNLLELSRISRQEQLLLQEELLSWAELDLMRQQANQLAGVASKQQSWEKMTELEMKALELSFQMQDISSKLENSLLRKVSEQL